MAKHRRLWRQLQSRLNHLALACIYCGANVVFLAQSSNGGSSKKWRKKQRFKRALNTQKSCNSLPTRKLFIFFFGLIALFRSTVHSGTCNGTKADARHWVGEFSTGSGRRMIKAHIYVLPNKQRGKWLKHLGKYERSALGDIIYQKEWRPGVKHVQR